MLHDLVLYIHVASALSAFLVHGATASATFALKRETDPARLEAILTLRDAADRGASGPWLALLISGIVLGFMGSWWRDGWLWLSIGLFLVVAVSMSLIGRMANMRVAHAVDPEAHDSPSKKEDRGDVAASMDELAALQAKVRPILVTSIGVIGLGAILWLMMFKPF